MTKSMTTESRLPLVAVLPRAVDDLKLSVVVVTGAMFVYRDGFGELRYLVPFVLLYGLFAVLWELLSWSRFSYRVIDGQEIRIRSGVVRRRHRTVQFDRIEHVSLLDSLASRAVGVTGVYCETAGTRDESEIELRYVAPETARRLRRALDSNRTDDRIGAESAETRLYELSFPHLLASSVLRTNYVPVMVAVGAVVSVAVLPVEATSSFSALVVTTVRPLLPDVFGGSKWGALVLLAICAGWGFGVLRHIAAMYQFRLSSTGDTLYCRHGLFSRLEKEIPIDNVQIVRCSDGPILRAFGRSALEVQTAGGSELTPFNARTTLVPLAERATVETIATRIVPLDFEAQRDLPERARSRYVVRYLVLASIAVVAAIVARGHVAVLASIPLRAYVLPAVFVPVAAHVRWSAVSYAFGPDHLYISRGFWMRREYVIAYDDVQQYKVSQSLFQRRHGLATLRVETAAYPLSIGAVVPDIEAETAMRLGGDATASRTPSE